MKSWIALSAATVGIGLAVLAGDLWSRLAWIAGGLAAAFTALNLGVALNDIGGAKISAALATCFAVVGIFLSSDWMAQEGGEFNAKAQRNFMEAAAGLYGPLDERSLDVVSRGMRLCSTQLYSDALDTTLALSGALHVPNSASLVSGVWSAMNPEPQRPNCESAYRLFQELRASASGS